MMRVNGTEQTLGSRRGCRNHAVGFIGLLIAATLCKPVIAAETPGMAVRPLSPHEQAAEDILRELVGFESTVERPDQIRLALEAMAARLLAAGYPPEDVVVINPLPDKYGLVARLRGLLDPDPILTMAHIDVVTADPEAWAFPPFTFGSRDGYYFGRGTQDNKTGVAHLVANFVRLKEENYVPRRDLILMVTGDEETEGRVARWLANEGKELIDAEYALNTDGGGGQYTVDFKPRAFRVQTSEKVYQSYQLKVTNPGGHSSLPRPDNAIYEMASALVRIAAYQFPVMINPNSKVMFERSARLEDGQMAADLLAVANQGPDARDAISRLEQDAYLNALMRTTCVATGIEGGQAENALPRGAVATINCRILPGVDPRDVEAQLRAVVADDSITFTSVYDALPSPASELPDALLESLETLVEEFWPGVPVIPEMSTGATDGLFLRNSGMPVFGVAGWFMRPGDVRAHGLDEKIGIAEFHRGTEYWYRMLLTLSQP